MAAGGSNSRSHIKGSVCGGSAKATRRLRQMTAAPSTRCCTEPAASGSSEAQCHDAPATRIAARALAGRHGRAGRAGPLAADRVRRILVQKMRLLAARTGERPPSDADLEAFYADHRNEYRPPDRVTFWHVFLASSAHGSSTLSDAEARLSRLRRQAHSPEEAVRQGDSFSVPPHVIAESPARLEKLFGAEFAMAVQRGETRTWIGPVPSPYGMHLVWIEAREPGTPPPFAAVRDRVLDRWQDEERTRRAAELLRDLARRYPLRVESAAWRQRGAS